METPFLLMIVLSTGGLLIPSIEVLSRGKLSHQIPRYIALGALLASLVIVFIQTVTQQVSPITTSQGLFGNDYLGLFFSFVVLLVSALVAAASFEYFSGDANEPIYYSLLLFAALGMSLLAFAADLLILFAAWELMSLPTYVMAGFKKNDVLSSEAAVKYFILGALSSGILLYGISLVYGLTGTTNLQGVLAALGATVLQLSPVALLALALLLAGFGLKLSAVPFHMWIPDAYEGAPTTVSTLLAAGTKSAGFVAAIRVFLVALVLLRLDWSTAFAVLALITMTLGNVAALTQRSITRLLAYSSIAQAGYIMIGLAVAPFSGLAVVGVLFHTFTHAVMKSSAFIAAAAVGYKTLKSDLDTYNGLGFRMPLTSFALAIALLALAGVPPLNGFWSKLILFTAAIEGNMAWLAIAGVLNSAFSLGYYAWIIKRMYMDEPRETSRIEEPRVLTTTLIIATFIIVLTGVFPGPIVDFAQRALIAP